MQLWVNYASHSPFRCHDLSNEKGRSQRNGLLCLLRKCEQRYAYFFADSNITASAAARTLAASWAAASAA